MCTGAELIPLAAAGLSTAASLGGTFMQSKAAEKQYNREVDAQVNAANAEAANFVRKNDALEAESQRVLQNRLQGERQSVGEQVQEFVNNRRQTSDTNAQDVAADPSQGQQGMDYSQSIDRVLAPLRGSAPKVVKDEAEKQVGDVRDTIGREREALAGTRAFGDLFFNKGLETARAGQDLGTIGGMVSANADLLPLQQDLAIGQARQATQGSGLSPTGLALSGIGSLGVQAAGSGAFDRLAGTTAPKLPVTSNRPKVPTIGSLY